jgi:hypothetical protein
MFNLPINLLEDQRLNVSERSLQPLRFMQVAQLRAELAMSRASEAGHQSLREGGTNIRGEW